MQVQPLVRIQLHQYKRCRWKKLCCTGTRTFYTDVSAPTLRGCTRSGATFVCRLALRISLVIIPSDPPCLCVHGKRMQHLSVRKNVPVVIASIDFEEGVNWFEGGRPHTSPREHVSVKIQWALQLALAANLPIN